MKKGLVCFVGTTAAKFVVYKRRLYVGVSRGITLVVDTKRRQEKEVAFGDEETTVISIRLFQVVKPKKNAVQLKGLTVTVNLTDNKG